LLNFQEVSGMSTFLNDVRYGLRMLSKSPGFTLIAVFALALGIGANSAIFSVVNAMLLRPLPFPEPDRLVVIWETNPNLSANLRLRNEASPANLKDWTAQSTSFENIAAFRWDDYNLTGGDLPEQLLGHPVTVNMFDTLKTRPLLGRTFLPDEGNANAGRVVVLSYKLWQRRFGANSGIVNQNISLNGESYTVVGVMPPEFAFPAAASELWVPMRFEGQLFESRQAHFLYTRARLKPGVTLAQAQAEMDTIAARLRQQYPETNTDRGVRLVSLHEESVHQLKPALLALLGAVGFVLLIACANVANLMLARATARHKEIAIRTALGASRWRVVRQLLTESVLLSLVGGALGILFAMWGVDLLLASVPKEFSLFFYGWDKIGLDLRVLSFTVGVSILTGLIFGLAPALQASKFDLNESLKDGGRTSGVAAGGARRGLRGVLVVAEVALALVLLVGAGLMIKSFIRLLDVRPGFDPQNLLTMQLSLPGARYGNDAQVLAFYGQLHERLKSQPGVEGVGFVNYLPMAGSGGTTNFIFEGRPAPPVGQYPEANFRIASTDYFATMKIPLSRGRNFNAQDRADSPRVVVINETLARLYFPNEDPLGKRLLSPDGTNPSEIIGVVGDVKHFGLEDEAESYLYVPHAQNANGTLALVLRSHGDPQQMTALVRREVSALDKDQPVVDIKNMEQRLSETMSPRRLTVFLLGIFASVAMILAAVGIYGVIAYSVTQRTHEFGIRMALGAQRGDIIRLVIGQGMWLVLVGLAVGLVGAFAMTRLMESLLFQVKPGDPLTFAVVALLLSAVALLACYIPARRATKVDPMIALRYE
jgi:putative ABC transport system permease protein